MLSNFFFQPKRLPFGGGASNVDDDAYESTGIEEFDSQRTEGPLDGASILLLFFRKRFI